MHVVTFVIYTLHETFLFSNRYPNFPNVHGNPVYVRVCTISNYLHTVDCLAFSCSFENVCLNFTGFVLYLKRKYRNI